MLCHHEFLDGTGYPRGLVGDEVPLEARIVSVADIFDALTSHRPYKKQWSLDEAFAELSLLADQGKLDNDCVMALIEQTETVQHVMTTYIDGDA